MTRRISLHKRSMSTNVFNPFISNDREEDSGGDDGGGLWDDEGVYDRPWH